MWAIRECGARAVYAGMVDEELERSIIMFRRLSAGVSQPKIIANGLPLARYAPEFCVSRKIMPYGVMLCNSCVKSHGMKTLRPM